MAKELLTNIKSTIDDGIRNIIASNTDASSITMLYNWESTGTHINPGVQVELTDSINNYDFIIVEPAASTSAEFWINPACIPKPLPRKTEAGIKFDGYLLDLYYEQTNYKRMRVEFPTDTSIMIGSITNLGTASVNLSIRNVYGVKSKVPTLSVYSVEETPVAVWDDGKTIYRKIVELGNLTVVTTDKQIERPHGISNIDKVINVKGVFERKSTGESFVLPYVLGDNTTVAYVKGDNIVVLNNKSVWNSWDFYCIVEYTKI